MSWHVLVLFHVISEGCLTGTADPVVGGAAELRPICSNLLYHAWGEDIFIDQCMIASTSGPLWFDATWILYAFAMHQHWRRWLVTTSREATASVTEELGLTRVNEFDVMSEIARALGIGLLAFERLK